MNSNLLPSDHQIPKNFVKGKLLGEGGFAKVYEFTNTEKKIKLAGKVIEKASLLKSRSRQKLLSEIKIHKSLTHIHVLKLYSFYEDKDYIYIMLELCSNNNLSLLLKRRKRLTEQETRYYVYQLLLALRYIHSLKVIHRDIKLGNLLLTEKMEIKLADFGLATTLQYEGERKRTICGTPNYIAPEVLEGNHSYEVDIWSMGVLLYTLLIGYPPFQTSDRKVTYNRIKSSLYVFPDYVPLSHDSKDLISKMLVRDPIARISLDGIFSHNFFTKNEIPMQIPVSTVAIPPSQDFLKQFNENASEISDISTSSSEETLMLDGIWVDKWIKHQNIIGYVLNNSHVGILFEDETHAIANNQEFIYIDNRKAKYSYLKYPPLIKNKVAFLKYCVQHFRINTKENLDNIVYVKKCVQKQHAIMFKLVNKTVQVKFTDKSQLIILGNTKEIVYINKLDQKTHHLLSKLDEITNKDLITRLRYTHSLLKSE